MNCKNCGKELRSNNKVGLCSSNPKCAYAKHKEWRRLNPGRETRTSVATVFCDLCGRGMKPNTRIRICVKHFEDANARMRYLWMVDSKYRESAARRNKRFRQSVAAAKKIREELFFKKLLEEYRLAWETLP